ncbi:tol-pal system protein YbgF [Thermodesulfobacteriota bacterium]
MKKRLALLLLYIVLGLHASGCITTLRQKNTESDLIALQKKVAEMEKNFDSQLIKSIDASVKEVDSNYKKSIEDSLRNQASIESDLETIRLDFRRVKGNVEEIAYKAERYLTEDKAKIEDNGNRLRDLELSVAEIKGTLTTLENNQKYFMSSRKQPTSGTMTTGPELTSVIPTSGATATTDTTGSETMVTPTTGDATAGTVDASTLVTPTAGTTDATGTDTATVATATTGTVDENAVPEEVQMEYDSAYSVFKDGNFDDAMSLFSDFVKKYPATKVTDNAQYWVAECYYKKKEFDKAILEYDKMVAKYPESDKVPSALLKEGFSLLQLKYEGPAITKLKELIAGYPETDQAEIARRKLKVLEK